MENYLVNELKSIRDNLAEDEQPQVDSLFQEIM